MLSRMRLLSMLAILMMGMGMAHAQAPVLPRPPQYILMSFDGSYTLEMWQATREHGEKNNARYTHFISGVDFLAGSTDRKIPGAIDSIYRPPRYSGHGTRSLVGFGGPREMVAQRVQQVVKSIQAGMEIGGHANGHFDGSKWSESEWLYEFNLFHDYVWNVISLNKLEDQVSNQDQAQWKALMQTQHVGFRAPFLGRGEGLWKTLGQDRWKIDNVWTDHRYRYDASDVIVELSAWPAKTARGFWSFPLVTLPVPGRSGRILSMDYNFYLAQSGAKENPSRGSQYEEQMYQAYMNWFSRNYYGNRAPLNIGHHFSTWNKGAYWRALQRFVESVCSQPEVACITYHEMVDILDQGLAQNLAALSKGQFDQKDRPQLRLAMKTSVASPASEGVVFQGRYLVSKEGATWEARGEVLPSPVDLVQLARSGVSTLTHRQGKETRELVLDWNPFSNETRLRALTVESIQACPPEAHREDVNPADLVRGQDI